EAQVGEGRRRQLLQRPALPQRQEDPERLATDDVVRAASLVVVRRQEAPARRGHVPLVRLAGLRAAQGVEVREAARRQRLRHARVETRYVPSGSSSLYPTPHSFATSSASGAAARSLRRSRDACASTVRVRERARKPQTSRSSSSFVNTRSGSDARCTSRSYSFCDRSMRTPATVTKRARRSIVSGPATSGVDRGPPDRRRTARIRSTSSS